MASMKVYQMDPLRASWTNLVSRKAEWRVDPLEQWMAEQMVVPTGRCLCLDSHSGYVKVPRTMKAALLVRRMVQERWKD